MEEINYDPSELVTNFINFLLPDFLGLDGTAEGALLIVAIVLVIFFIIIFFGPITDWLAKTIRRSRRRKRNK